MKLLGVDFDSKLKFNSHIDRICERPYRNLNTLARITSFIDLSKQKIVFNSFSNSEFNYCFDIWKFHKLTHYMNVVCDLSMTKGNHGLKITRQR